MSAHLGTIERPAPWRSRQSPTLAGRADGGTLRRFESIKPHADRAMAALRADHPALFESRTIFPTTVVAADDAPRLLVSGHNSPKIGREVRKGPWRGMPIFTLTLEERASCPPSCGLLRECYGNSMPLARRHRIGPDLDRRLVDELCALSAEHPGGFVVRLHVLGDFHSWENAEVWIGAMIALPQVHVWGYTAHALTSPMGSLLRQMNDRWPDRWVIRFSGAPDAPAVAGFRAGAATTIWRKPEAAVVPEGIVCPAQTGATEACATCGLCWAPGAWRKRIVFVGHGMATRGHGGGKRV